MDEANPRQSPSLSGHDVNKRSKWFEAEELRTGVTRITEPDVHRFFRANLYHVKGRDADMVVDFGMGLQSLRRFLALEESKPVFAVATHVHVDHVGSFYEFDHRLGHVIEANAFSMMTDTDTLANFFRERPDAVANAPYPAWKQEDYTITPAPLTHILTEGARIDLGDVSYRVLHLPGHSPGSIGLLDEGSGILFSGDAIYDGTLVDDLPGCDKGEYRRTMERLRDLDVSVVFGGHGNPMSGEQMQDLAATYLKSPT
jgi:glyoxylase-like metal-dependent hydrolase (beta-lactamase superfamily II)